MFTNDLDLLLISHGWFTKTDLSTTWQPDHPLNIFWAVLSHRRPSACPLFKRV